jgi:hypothetical protein
MRYPFPQFRIKACGFQVPELRTGNKFCCPKFFNYLGIPAVFHCLESKCWKINTMLRRAPKSMGAIIFSVYFWREAAQDTSVTPRPSARGAGQTPPAGVPGRGFRLLMSAGVGGSASASFT